MIYNPSGWVSQYQKIIDSQKEAAKIMKGNATLLNIGHSKMPSEFFRRFGNNL
jgi:hypothetical protein